MLRRLLLYLIILILAPATAWAQSPASECLAIAQGKAQVHFAALKPNEARLAYIGHSTFIVESPQDIRIATDYAGHATGIVPDVVTMNHAHSSHYTDFPDPAIKHVLKGWGENGTAANHNLEVGDVRIRNVPTDIRAGEGIREKDGNSIFIFELAGLCIGHLGHLHHELTPEHIARIGRLDVVMVPVDGGMTLPVENLMAVLKELRVRIILPMHARFAGSLERFQTVAAREFRIERLTADEIIVSANSLPQEPTVYIMPGM
jgi:L-ascorbate metabolism protein UlaG (beta-lactamase superfamily)